MQVPKVEGTCQHDEASPLRRSWWPPSRRRRGQGRARTRSARDFPPSDQTWPSPGLGEGGGDQCSDRRKDPNKHSDTELGPCLPQMSTFPNLWGGSQCTSQRWASHCRSWNRSPRTSPSDQTIFNSDNFVLALFPPGLPSCRSSKPRTG